MAVTLDQIKKLREMTGVSMMACKKALEDSDGDMDKAIDLLRKKGEAKAVDRAERSTDQGVVAIKSEGAKASMVKLQSETDFVSRGEDFVNLAESLAGKLFNGEMSTEDTDVSEVKDAVLKMGENIQIGGMELIEGEVLGSYVHSNKKIGVVVSLKGGNEELAKDLAMHVAATNPTCTSPDEVSQESVDKEKEIWKDQLAQEGKPEEIMEKIMMGKEKKFREEHALIKQTFVKDPEKTIEQLLEEGGATIESFVRMTI
ncbi:translation elongation factor Ts [Candidatus Peregrinibacteria bacterium]|jgi:elongation factor Ts|nr:translation elongation factor Ts [Candidatus Peregrinibacteria bacterium]MBT4055703.1 translation elongation factor Ts [Candidatus Peregrinibacteria bacterium]